MLFSVDLKCHLLHSILKIDLDLLTEELGNDKHGISLYKAENEGNLVYILAETVFAVTGPGQGQLTPDGDPPRPHPPLPDQSLYEIWSSRDLDYGLSIDFATLNDREKDALTKGTELEYAENNPKGEYGPSTYSLTAKGFNACEEMKGDGP